MGTPYKWKLEGSELVKNDARGFAPPYTASLASTAATRAIQITVDGGDTWQDTVADIDEPGVLAVTLNARVGGIKFIGEEGDTARIIAN